MNSACLLANEARLEEHLRAAEALAANSNYIAIGKLVCFLLVRTFAGRLHFCVEVKSNVAELLLDITHDLTLSCCGEGVATLCENLHEIFCEVTASEVQTKDGMWQSISFINWHSVRDTIARVHDNTCGAAWGIERKHSLDSHIHS